MFKRSLQIFVLASLVCGSAWADSSLNISGNVVASPCTVDTDTVNKSVDLGVSNRLDLESPGEGGEWADFDLVLKDCPAGTTNVTAILSGTADSQDATAWKNSGTSSNMALRIANRSRDTAYGTGSTIKTTVNSTSRDATFPLSARMFTPLGNAQIGTFSAVMNVDFTWQ